MTHLYFFNSCNENDEVSTITILTTSARKAFALACKHFYQNGYTGIPQMIAI